MKYCITLLLLVAILPSSSAHQPDVSTTLLSQQENGQWVLQVKAAMTAFQYEVNTHFSAQPYESPEQFEEQVAQHLTENIAIVFDGKIKAKLTAPFVKLGHETNVIFQLDEVPEIFTTVAVMNSSFEDIFKNQSGLIILKDGFAKTQFVLNNSNEHTAEVLLQGNTFVAKDTVKIAKSQPNLIWLVAVAIAGLILFLLNTRRKKLALEPIQ